MQREPSKWQLLGTAVRIGPSPPRPESCTACGKPFTENDWYEIEVGTDSLPEGNYHGGCLPPELAIATP